MENLRREVETEVVWWVSVPVMVVGRDREIEGGQGGLAVMWHVDGNYFQVRCKQN